MSVKETGLSAREQGIAVAACGAALVTLVPVLLYQTGVIERLPDPPGAIFDSETITSSGIAHPLGIPDAALGIGAYGVALGLVLAARRSVVARRLMAAHLTVLAGNASFNSVRQIAQFRRLCSWCMGTVAATGVLFWSGKRVIQTTLAEGLQATAMVDPGRRTR